MYNNSNSVIGATTNQPQFGDSHHRIYNQLRQVIMNLHQQGVPGMDNVLKALNDSHIKYSAPQQQKVNPFMQQMMQQNHPETGQVVRAPMNRMGGY